MHQEKYTGYSCGSEVNQLDHIPEQVKKTIIEERLKELLKRSFISQETYDQIVEAQLRYQQSMSEEDIQVDKRHASTVEGDHTAAEQFVHQDITPAQKEQDPVATVSKQGASVNSEGQQPKKRKLSAEEIRERNITWLLGIGVVCLLIAGTFLATSTWYMLPDIMKTLLLTVVAGLFFGLAILTDKVLKIRKTGFAFYILGALFLPIVILSIGFYGHLGYYLSMDGEGRYLFGTLGSLVLLPIYLMIAKRLSSKLFVWFSYVSITLVAGFFIGWLHLPIDGFYLGMVLFNSVLIFFYQYVKKQKKWIFFIEDFAKYIQANLILTSVFVIFFYDQALMNGFNLIITAVLYLMMIFVANYREYHYVFTLLFVYGAYQLIEFSGLQSADVIFYALVGFIFLFLPKILPEEYRLTHVFQYTSVIISGLAFIFISFKAMVLTIDESSFMMVVAYLMIASNFIYAANRFEVRGQIFSYISTVFLLVASYELVYVVQTYLHYESIVLPFFFMAFLIYIVFGCVMTQSSLKVIKQASRDVSLMVMGSLVIIHLGIGALWEMGLMFFLLSLVALLLWNYETRYVESIRKFVTWLHGLFFGIAVMFFYGTGLLLLCCHKNICQHLQ